MRIAESSPTATANKTDPKLLVKLRAEELVNSSFASIDDLEFQGDPAPPLPTDPPVVHLTQPVDGINVDIPNDIPCSTLQGSSPETVCPRM